MKRMKKFRKVFAIAAAVLLVIACIAPMIAHAEEPAKRSVVFYDLQEIQDDESILLNRTPDTVIVERCIGVVIDDSTGEGKLIYDDPVYNYIWYDPARFSNWDVVVTYNIYNPETQYTDDVLYRLDFKIGNLMDLYGH